MWPSRCDPGQPIPADKSSVHERQALRQGGRPDFGRFPLDLPLCLREQRHKAAGGEVFGDRPAALIHSFARLLPTSRDVAR